MLEFYGCIDVNSEQCVTGVRFHFISYSLRTVNYVMSVFLDRCVTYCTLSVRLSVCLSVCLRVCLFVSL